MSWANNDYYREQQRRDEEQKRRAEADRQRKQQEQWMQNTIRKQDEYRTQTNQNSNKTLGIQTPWYDKKQ
jgi:hypothetical protein